jgi:hypothetical protein
LETCVVIAVVLGVLTFLIGTQLVDITGALEIGAVTFLVVFIIGAFLRVIAPMTDEGPFPKTGPD